MTLNCLQSSVEVEVVQSGLWLPNTWLKLLVPDHHTNKVNRLQPS